MVGWAVGGAARVGAALTPSLSLLAIAAPIQHGALVVTALVLAAALVVPDRRRRALLMLAAATCAALTLATLASRVPDVPPLQLGAAAVGGVVVLVLASVIHRRPLALPLLAVAALPFRLPVSIGATAANLLLPLYAVIAAGTLAYAWRALRAPEQPDPEREPLLRRLTWAFA